MDAEQGHHPNDAPPASPPPESPPPESLPPDSATPADPATPQPALTPRPHLTAAMPPYRAWLHALCVLLALSTFVLIGVGGTVTSLEAGMAFPDGWTSGEYFSPLAPLQVWWHDLDKRWEHGHRLMGTWVGLLTIATAMAIHLTQRRRPGLKCLALFVLGMVVVQGILGAYRVDLISDFLAMVHGIFGQVVLLGTVALVVLTSKLWMTVAADPPRLASREATRPLRITALLLVGLLVGQLALGAAVRHADAALAIPDVPWVYGGLVPPLTQQGIHDAVAALPESMNYRQPTVGQVMIHYAHRLGALVVSLFAFYLFVRLFVSPYTRRQTAILVPALTVMILLTSQVVLGLLVVLREEHPEVATTHQSLGAVLLASAWWLFLRTQLIARRVDDRGQPVAPDDDQATRSDRADAAASRHDADRPGLVHAGGAMA